MYNNPHTINIGNNPNTHINNNQYMSFNSNWKGQGSHPKEGDT